MRTFKGKGGFSQAREKQLKGLKARIREMSYPKYLRRILFRTKCIALRQMANLILTQFQINGRKEDAALDWFNMFKMLNEANSRNCAKLCHLLICFLT
jgi:hypothetical protein